VTKSKNRTPARKEKERLAEEKTKTEKGRERYAKATQAFKNQKRRGRLKWDFFT